MRDKKKYKTKIFNTVYEIGRAIVINLQFIYTIRHEFVTKEANYNNYNFDIMSGLNSL